MARRNRAPYREAPAPHVASTPAAVTNGTGETVAMRQIQVTIASTGKPAIIALPVDLSDGELAELCGWLLTAVLNAYRDERTKGAAARIILPGRVS